MEKLDKSFLVACRQLLDELQKKVSTELAGPARFQWKFSEGD